MSVQPDGKVAKIEFAEQRVTLWNTNAVAMGSTLPEVTAWQTKVENARAAYQAQKAAQNAAKAATNDFHLAVTAMTDATGDIIKQVKTRAAIDGDAVYSLAEIPVPATPSPKAPPGAPYEMKASLDGNGALNLAWKCANPRGSVGTMYAVYRQLDGATGWESLGVSGVRKFVDATIPAGGTKVTYKIRGIRSTAGGPWTQFVVQFGTNAGGATTASISTAPSAPKLAA